MASVTGDYSRLYSTVCTVSDRPAGDSNKPEDPDMRVVRVRTSA